MKSPLLPGAFVGVVDVEEIKSNGNISQRTAKDESGRVQKTYFHPNGEIKLYEEWYKNRRHGLHTNYNTSGVPIDSSWWINGVRSESWKVETTIPEDSQT